MKYLLVFPDSFLNKYWIPRFKKTNNKNLAITSSLNEERLFLFLEEIISLQALLANKVPINKRVQLEAIIDLI